jgi:hypothetical protein
MYAALLQQRDPWTPATVPWTCRHHITLPAPLPFYSSGALADWRILWRPGPTCSWLCGQRADWCFAAAATITQRTYCSYTTVSGCVHIFTTCAQMLTWPVLTFAVISSYMIPSFTMACCETEKNIALLAFLQYGYLTLCSLYYYEPSCTHIDYSVVCLDCASPSLLPRLRLTYLTHVWNLCLCTICHVPACILLLHACKQPLSVIQTISLGGGGTACAWNEHGTFF